MRVFLLSLWVFISYWHVQQTRRCPLSFEAWIIHFQIRRNVENAVVVAEGCTFQFHLHVFLIIHVSTQIYITRTPTTLLPGRDNLVDSLTKTTSFCVAIQKACSTFCRGSCADGMLSIMQTFKYLPPRCNTAIGWGAWGRRGFGGELSARSIQLASLCYEKSSTSVTEDPRYSQSALVRLSSWKRCIESHNTTFLCVYGLRTIFFERLQTESIVELLENVVRIWA